MRIIAGLLRGRKLISPKGGDVRPTSDKVKEAMFSMLLPYMEEDFVAMDVFTGSGNLGLEAISRGVLEKIVRIAGEAKSLLLGVYRSHDWLIIIKNTDVAIPR